MPITDELQLAHIRLHSLTSNLPPRPFILDLQNSDAGVVDHPLQYVGALFKPFALVCLRLSIRGTLSREKLKLHFCPELLHARLFILFKREFQVDLGEARLRLISSEPRKYEGADE